MIWAGFLSCCRPAPSLTALRDLFARQCQKGVERAFERAGRPSMARLLARRLLALLPDRNGLAAKIFLAGVVFAQVPFIIYDRLGDAERSKSDLLFQSARDQGRLITTYLSPLFRDGPKSLPQIDKALEALATGNLNIRILYRPLAARNNGGFYYVAANPVLGGDYLQSEIEKLAAMGVLSRLSESCLADETIGTRHALADGPQHLITAIIPFASPSGCWAVVTSYAGEGFLGSSFGRPYWQSSEIQFASVLYFSAAILTLVILIRIRTGLRAFRATAMSTGRRGATGSFAEANENPDLNGVAAEFDNMVQRIGLLSFAVERSPIAIAVAGRDWRIAYVNPACCTLSGKSQDELIGVDLRRKEYQILGDTSWDKICARVERGGTWHGEIQRQKPDGRTIWAEVSLYRLSRDGQQADHFVCLQEDVTERQQLLNRLVSEKEKAQALNRMKSSFIAHMSHEFRTPLNAIIGFSEMVAKESFGPCNPPRYVEYAGYIHNSGQHLLSLINDILDLSKLESGKETLHLEALDLSVLIDSMTGIVGPQAESAHVALAVDCRLGGRLVLADERAVRQVLLNLLSNGIKFTPAGGTVTTMAEPVSGDRIRLTVSDTGCGIAADELPKICEPYARANNAETRAAAGTGLGLPIVKRLVERQNGAFTITSTVGAGTQVEVILPAIP
ncbi:MAG: PAS domain-containing sensor histidine kinase, partial [Proteobacteria bacterium]|nr:PAS domain-containing sensor histidine kinase [Pseudomonadota bacterium]